MTRVATVSRRKQRVLQVLDRAGRGTAAVGRLRGRATVKMSTDEMSVRTPRSQVTSC